MCKSLLLLGLLVLYLNQAWAIHCYFCNSFYDADCADVTKLEKYKKNCDSLKEYANVTMPITMCRKVLQVIEVEYKEKHEKPDTRVIRQCGWQDSQYTGKCYKRAGFGGRQDVCTCQDEFCNSSSNNKPFFMLLGSCIFITMLKKIF